MPRKLSVKEAKQKAGRFCAYRERSPQEVSNKLTGWGLEESEVSEVMDVLQTEGYVNEQRFANAYCHDKFEFNSWGRQKIKAHIFTHGIADDVVNLALDQLDPTRYEQRIGELASHKWKSLPSEEDVYKKKQKTAAYLSGKGFEPDLIWPAIARCEKNSP